MDNSLYTNRDRTWYHILNSIDTEGLKGTIPDSSNRSVVGVPLVL